ncbi:MAG TPA: hypothetical protein PL072_06550 [Phycisphaerales bacterium]|nr:hypothetical protein [Phycisphaerales bacterium]
MTPARPALDNPTMDPAGRCVSPARRASRGTRAGAALRAFALSGLLGAGLCGCRADVSTQSAVGIATQDELVSESTPPAGAFEAESISSRAAQRVVLQPWGRNADPSQRLTVTRERTTNDQNEGLNIVRETWVLKRTRTGGKSDPDKQPEREQRLVLTEGGSVALSDEINRTEGFKIEFEPPLYVLPAELPASGSPCVFEEVKMTVRPLSDLSRVEASGKVRHSVCYEADETLRSPAGPLRTHRLVSRFSADLGPSKVENITTQWYVEGVGLVAERRHEQTWALGLKIRNNRESWIAAEISK